MISKKSSELTLNRNDLSNSNRFTSSENEEGNDVDDDRVEEGDVHVYMKPFAMNNNN
jgi:hypothetical protein